MNEDCPRKKVAIEDLLRLKRAERPPPEFWSRFEHELRAKQLAAIVEKRPWWRGRSRSVPRFSRAHLSLSAAAVLAITVLTVREYRSPTDEQNFAKEHGAVLLPPASAQPDLTAAFPVPASVAMEYPDDTASDDQVAVVSSSSRFAPAHEVRAEDLAPNTEASVEYAAGIADTRTVDANLVASLGGNSGFEARALPSRSPLTEPLSQLATPKSVRLRDRYLGGAFSAGYSVDAGPLSPQRPVNRLRPEDFSRFDARGNSLSIKL
jgi:hypothetical protein